MRTHTWACGVLCRAWGGSRGQQDKTHWAADSGPGRFWREVGQGIIHRSGSPVSPSSGWVGPPGRDPAHGANRAGGAGACREILFSSWRTWNFVAMVLTVPVNSMHDASTVMRSCILPLSDRPGSAAHSPRGAQGVAARGPARCRGLWLELIWRSPSTQCAGEGPWALWRAGRAGTRGQGGPPR